MADRNLDFDQTVVGVTPEKPDLGLLTGGAEIADQVATMSANAKALNATTQSALAFRQADAKYRQDASGNPNDPEALANLQATRAQITSQIGGQVPAIASREYMTHMMEVQQNSDKLNELWGMQQSVKNAHADTETSMKTSYQMSGQNGMQWATDGGNFANLDSVLNIEQQQQAIAKFATPVLGEPQTMQLMQNFNRNSVQSFVTGAAQVDPEKAAMALQQPNIASHFTPQELDDTYALIKKTQKQQQFLKSLTTTNNNGAQLANLVNDPNTTYEVKSNQIFTAIGDGSIDSKVGHAAINILHSQKAVDAQTDDAVMRGIHDQVSDLNSNAKLRQDDYLFGVKGVQQQVYDAMNNGTLTKYDGTYTLKWIDSYTHSKISSATNTAGMEMHNAQKMFSDLPPQYRDVAIRNLFYATRDNNGHDQKLTQQQYAAKAAIVKDQINNQRRQDAVGTIKAVTQTDDQVLQSAGYTMKDVEETADKYGKSPQAIIQHLRINAISAERAKGHAIKSIKAMPDNSPDDDVTAPAQESTPSAGNELENEMNQ